MMAVTMGRTEGAMRAALAALMFMLLVHGTALADGGDGDTVTKTFKLELSGEVAGDQIFFGFVGTREAIASEEGVITLLLFCGDVPEEVLDEIEADPTLDLVVASSEPCESGGGAEYAPAVELERGAEIAFVVIREGPGPEDFEILAETAVDEGGNPAEYETIGEDTTNMVSCRLREGSCGTGAEDDTLRMPSMVPEGAMGIGGGGEPELPETGAGAAAGAGLPPGAAAAPLALLGASAYAALRRR